MLVKRLAIVLLVLLLLAGGLWMVTMPLIDSASDVTPERVTRWELKWISLAVLHYCKDVGVADQQRSIARLRSSEELFLLLNRTKNPSGHRIVADEDRASFERDGWNRPFSLKVTVDKANTTLRVISSGANGVFEDGFGDDLYFELTLKENEVIRAFRAPPVTEDYQISPTN